MGYKGRPASGAGDYLAEQYLYNWKTHFKKSELEVKRKNG